ncbi:Syd protein [Streptomyces sp. NBRC 110611]|uniref:DUF1996 domain-containing protein n=1 Tax=Streptomyces sp. NBRC 110611 TaxID=1621259 RepID=UPI0008581E75|nr:DUF1996 domain-containing protein [Streptomyces sp. NBRC 110611]GAU68027.1 Syd protein [Streptomyces sp. NBRC 110611]
MLVAAAALLLGGGGLAAVATTALAGDAAPEAADGHQRHSAVVAATLSCPDVGERLREVPRSAQLQVSKGLAALDRQVHDAYHAMMGGTDSGTLLPRLRQQRDRTIGTIVTAIAKDAERPEYLTTLSGCTTKPGQPGQPAQQARNRGQGRPGGPSPADFVDITTVRPNADAPPFAAPQGRDATTGTFTTECGRNEEGHFNSDNVIVTPGVRNGAHHTHDYVGNTSTDGFSTDRSLAASGTTCRNGDQSTYYWPVLRRLDQNAERKPGAALDGNIGSVLTPATVTLTFRGSQAGTVQAMPRFLRVITGDAKAFTNGTQNANASWSCTGFEDRQLKDRYPLCPNGSQVVRTFAFQNCWDGRGTDSANHRAHVAFSDRNGNCPDTFRRIPQLVERVTYDVPPGTGFAVDSFPEQLRKPVTDHGDFINVMPDALMNTAVNCINTGRRCR